jgi:hypothetical protein
LTCLPLFLSNEATAVRRAISSNDTSRIGESLRMWEEKCTPSSPIWSSPISLLKLPGFIIVNTLFSLSKGSKRKTYVLSLVFRILFSLGGIGVALFILWSVTLSAMVVGYFTSKSGMGWDFGQRLSLATVFLPLQSLLSAVASTFHLYEH